MANTFTFQTSKNLPFWVGLLVFWLSQQASAQQIIWAKLFKLPDIDEIHSITQDEWGDMYVGGRSYYRSFLPGFIPRAMVYKLNTFGDTIFSLWTGVYGSVDGIAVDKEGIVRMAVQKMGNFSLGPTQLHLLSMTQDGFIFRRDTVQALATITSTCIGKDSSWILAGYRQNPLNGFYWQTYVQRVRKDGTIEPFFALNNAPDEQAFRVEQLPSGQYLVSGSAGPRVISYTFDENLSSYQPFKIWNNSITNPLSNGHVSRIHSNRFMIAGEGNPCIVGQVDSIKQKYWMHKQIGTQIPPQAMTDGSVVFGYLTSVGVPNPFYRIGQDSSMIWFISIKDSLVAKGINNAVDLKCFTYFEDQSAVVAGEVQNPATSRDPIFLKISNIGTPVTSLFKPKKGPLANETLAPWPNPSSGTLYLKQHFDVAHIVLYTLSGKEMGSYHIRFGQPIDISSLPKGLYMYRAVIDEKAYSGKVMKG